MPIITRKIQLHLCKEGLSDEERISQNNLLNHINDNLYRAANNISSKLYLDEHVSSLVWLKHKDYKELVRDLAKAKKLKNPDESVIAEMEARRKDYENEMTEQELAICKYADEMSSESLAYNFATELGLDIYGQILTQLKDKVHKDYKSDQKEVWEGKRSIRTYKKGIPIPFPWNNTIRIEAVEKVKEEGKETKNRRDREDYDFYLNWYNGIRFRLHFGQDRSNNYQIVKRCFKLDEYCRGNYQMKTSSIKMVNGTKEMYLLLVVDIPQEKHSLDNNIVLGVDLGINYPAYVATNITEDRKSIGSREHFLNTRMEISRRYHSLQRLQATASGKGRTKKLEPLDRLRDKERNWVHTQNHLFSRDVVNFAIQVKAATIHMEDLSGYGKDENGNVIEEKKFLLGKWSYFELQTMIKDKAQRAGIKVNSINPAYTSQTCSWCGEKGERKGEHFFCQNPKCKQYETTDTINADHNAARNIAKSKEIVK